MNRSAHIAAFVLIVLLVSATHASPTDLERADYKISLPANSTVEKEDGDIDLDHMTTINFPNDNTMIILVLDDKNAAEKAFGGMIARYKDKLKDSIERCTNTFEQFKATRSAIVNGRLNGLKFSFELGQIDAKRKAFIVVFTYTESEKAATSAMVQKAMETFTIKE